MEIIMLGYLNVIVLYIFIEMKQTEAIDKLMNMLEGDQLLLVVPIALECYVSMELSKPPQYISRNTKLRSTIYCLEKILYTKSINYDLHMQWRNTT